MYRALALLLTLIGVPALAQLREAPPGYLPPVYAETTQAPDTNSGEVGKRQTRQEAARKAGLTPLARINNRVPNRLQSRLRYRIDQDYDPQANAKSPFIIAKQRSRSVNRRR